MLRAYYPGMTAEKCEIYTFVVADKTGSKLSFVESDKGVACAVGSGRYSVRLKSKTSILTGLTEAEAVKALC